MKILVINCGSSSLKYQLFNMDTNEVMAKGLCERIGIEGSNLQHTAAGKDKVVIVSQQVLEKISTTDSMPEAVAVAKQQKYNLESIKQAKRVALIENIKDAGNLGTLIRSACAFSYDAIILCGDTVDIYNPKVVRSTVGALFKLPVVSVSLNEAKQTFSKSVFIASVVNHKDIVNPETVDYTKPFVLMLGSEADGLSDEAVDVADVKTTIPMSSKTESLNLSTSGSILFYISAR